MRGRAFLRGLLQTFVILLITAVLLEILLRIFPGLVPPFILADFNPAARERIAERLGLPTDRIVIFPPRDDGGPPRRLRIFRPFATVAWPMDEPGFVSSVEMDRDGFCNPPDQRLRGARLTSSATPCRSRIGTSRRCAACARRPH